MKGYLHYCEDCGTARKYGQWTAFGWVCRPCLIAVENAQMIGVR